MKNLELPSLSIFFPAYNDANSIEKLVVDVLEVVPALANDFEVIIINDGSTDNTREVLNRLEKSYPKVKVIEHEMNKGYGAALRSGFAAAQKDLIFYTDGDGQYDVREISKLFPLLNHNIDVVNGYKMERTDKLNRKLIGGLYNQLAHFLFPLPIRDVDCDFRLIRRKVLYQINLSSNSGSICVELVYKLHRAGANFKEIGVNHYARPYGRSQFFTFRRVSKTLFDFFLLWLKLITWRKS